ncbi:MAG: putative lipoprotein [Labilithrix sp.]|nr:putative lipoprotein [Labilithrix sp.]
MLLTLTPAAAAQACASTNDEVPPPKDAPAAVDGAASTDAADAAADTREASAFVPDPCNLISEILEAGPDAPADADLGCRYTLPCGIPDAAGFVLNGCDFYLYSAADPDAGDASLGCAVPASEGCSNGMYTRSPSAPLTFECLDCFGGGGRRPVGLRRAPKRAAASGLAAYFAQMAHDEAASVHAFVRMHDELSRLGAPASLVVAAQRSARDERRHARMMARRARALGAPVFPARVRRASRRTLEAIARENAVEGCVQETFGALLMRFQATRSCDASSRRLFARIADDETRHAALSWELARWAEAKLEGPARARVVAARARAVRSLRTKLAARSDAAACSDTRAIAGQPTHDEAIALLDGMIAELGLG